MSTMVYPYSEGYTFNDTALNTPWIDTGIDMVAGTVVHFVAGGLYFHHPGGFSNLWGPQGPSVATYNPSALVPSLPYGSLIAKIGTGGTPFSTYIASNYNKGLRIPITTSGRLYISINDDTFVGNASWLSSNHIFLILTATLNVVFTEGFDSYNTALMNSAITGAFGGSQYAAQNASPKVVMYGGDSIFSTGNVVSIDSADAPGAVGKKIKCTGFMNVVARLPIPNDFIVSFWYRHDQPDRLDLIGFCPWFTVQNPSGNGPDSIRFTNDRKLYFVGTLSTVSLPKDEWMYMEIKYHIHPTSGTLEVRKNGSVILSYTGNTGTGATLTALWFGGIFLSSGSVKYTAEFDDLVVMNGSTYLPVPTNIITLRPDRNTPFSQGQCGNTAASQYTLENEEVQDGDATYVNTCDEAGQWGFEVSGFGFTLPTQYKRIFALCPNVVTRKTSTALTDIFIGLASITPRDSNLSNGYNSWIGDYLPASNFRSDIFTTYFVMWELWPTTNYWTRFAVNNSYFGPYTDSGQTYGSYLRNDETHTTQTYLEVLTTARGGPGMQAHTFS